MPLALLCRSADLGEVQTSLLDAALRAAQEQSTQAAASSAPASDRRRSERVATTMPGWVSGESHDRSARGRDVTVVDLSMHGIGFRDTRGGYRPGATHWLVVNGGAMRMSTRVRIISCRPNEAGTFDVGAMFY